VTTTDQEPVAARELPYEGTVQDFRMQAARDAYRGERVIGRIVAAGHDRPGPYSPDARERLLVATSAASYGWGVLGLIRWVGDQYGPDAAWKAAAIAQDIGVNGGNRWCEDIPYPPTDPTEDVAG